MNVLQGALLGLIQGLGEFLPISSSGHLLLAQKLFGLNGSDAAMKMLDILLHVGTLIPVLLVFWREWIDMIAHPVRNKTLLKLITASVPTLVIYIIARKVLVVSDEIRGFSVFDSGWFLGVSFLVTAVFLLLCDRFAASRRSASSRTEVSFLQAVIMGIFQGAGLLPGVSRSGSTIFGGVASGLDKDKAARFSFMMSAPAILGSLLMEGKDAIEEGYIRDIDLFPSIVGIAVAAVTGFAALRFMLKMISKVPLSWFALYVVLLGIAWLLLQLAGSPLVPAFALPAAVPAAAPAEVENAVGFLRVILA